MKNFALAGALAATAVFSNAKTVTEHDGRKAHDVQVSIKNDDLCLFKNASDSWCISATPPMLRGGWEVTQKYTSSDSSDAPVIDYYEWQLNPYVEAQANFVSTLFIENAWVNVISFDI